MSLAWHGGEMEPLIARARDLLALGVEAIVVRCGRAEWRNAAACLQALRDTFGRDLRLRLAILRPLSPSDHERCVRMVTPLDLEYIQVATVRPHPYEMPQCTRNAIQEWDNLADALRSPAFQAFNLSVMGWGGVTGIARLAAACRVFQRQIVLSCDVAHGREVVLSAHVATALPAVSLGIEMPIELDDAIFAYVCQGILLPDPGLARTPTSARQDRHRPVTTRRPPSSRENDIPSRPDTRS
jgi:L-alanine-DL-glutamate epimerase-like enolase superfamily enzyme